MRALVELSVVCSSERTGRELGAVLAPDNAGTPKGLTLSMARRRSEVSVRLSSESPSTALSTALSILRDVSLFEQVWLLSRARDGHQRSL